MLFKIAYISAPIAPISLRFFLYCSASILFFDRVIFEILIFFRKWEIQGRRVRKTINKKMLALSHTGVKNVVYV